MCSYVDRVSAVHAAEKLASRDEKPGYAGLSAARSSTSN